jgi:mRNA interferase RelE/StbE
LAASAEKELKRLSGQLNARIVPRLEGLASNPRPPGCKKLKGGDKEWRIRVGDYRVVYTIDDATLLVVVTRVRHRSEVVWMTAEGARVNAEIIQLPAPPSGIIPSGPSALLTIWSAAGTSTSQSAWPGTRT